MTATRCQAVTTDTATGVAVACSCGWSARWHRLGPWDDGLPLRTPAQLRVKAARAVAVHLRAVPLPRRRG